MYYLAHYYSLENYANKTTSNERCDQVLNLLLILAAIF